MQPKIAKRAPVLRPVAVYATAPQDKATPSESQSHTRTDSVFVLLRAGLPLSTINTGSWYTGCSRLLNPPRFVNMEAVLSEKHEETMKSIQKWPHQIGTSALLVSKGQQKASLTIKTLHFCSPTIPVFSCCCCWTGFYTGINRSTNRWCYQHNSRLWHLYQVLATWWLITASD